MCAQRLRRRNVSTGPDDSASSTATATAGSEGSVEVIHGVFAHSYPLAGMTVRRARVELEERLNIDPEAAAVVDGIEVDEDTVLEEGQALTFVKEAGDKGTA